MCYVFVIGNVIFFENTLVLFQELYSRTVGKLEPPLWVSRKYGMQDLQDIQ